MQAKTRTDHIFKNPPHFFHRDAFIVGLCNSLTSVFAGVVVFAILGNLANGRPISEIVSVGCWWWQWRWWQYDAGDDNDDEIIPAIHRTGVCSLSRGHPDHGPAATLVRLILSRRSMSTINLLGQVVLVLLHADQPGPLLHLRRSPDFRRLHPRREARVDKVRVFQSWMMI